MPTGFKYVARVRGKNGKWRYIYKDNKAGSGDREKDPTRAFHHNPTRDQIMTASRYRDSVWTKLGSKDQESEMRSRYEKLKRGGKNSQSSYWIINDRQPAFRLLRQPLESRIAKRGENTKGEHTSGNFRKGEHTSGSFKRNGDRLTDGKKVKKTQKQEGTNSGTNRKRENKVKDDSNSKARPYSEPALDRDRKTRGNAPRMPVELSYLERYENARKKRRRIR